MLASVVARAKITLLDLAITSQPDLYPYSPSAHIANLAAPKVITSFMALISSGHCSHHRLNESGIMGNIKALGVIKGNPC